MACSKPNATAIKAKATKQNKFLILKKINKHTVAVELQSMVCSTCGKTYVKRRPDYLKHVKNCQNKKKQIDNIRNISEPLGGRIINQTHDTAVSNSFSKIGEIFNFSD